LRLNETQLFYRRNVNSEITENTLTHVDFSCCSQREWVNDWSSTSPRTVGFRLRFPVSIMNTVTLRERFLPIKTTLAVLTTWNWPLVQLTFYSAAPTLRFSDVTPNLVNTFYGELKCKRLHSSFLISNQMEYCKYLSTSIIELGISERLRECKITRAFSL